VLCKFKENLILKLTELISLATVHQWLPLLAAKENKELIIDYLKELSQYWRRSPDR
jgi:hypothetical protein